MRREELKRERYERDRLDNLKERERKVKELETKGNHGQEAQDNKIAILKRQLEIVKVEMKRADQEKEEFEGQVCKMKEI